MGAVEHASPNPGIRRMAASYRRLMHAGCRSEAAGGCEIRAIDAADAELLRRFDPGLSETSRRLYYLGCMPPLSSVEEAARWATVDFRDRLALVAVERQGEHQRIVADCRLVLFADRRGSLEGRSPWLMTSRCRP